jgi:hypothetical protein
MDTSTPALQIARTARPANLKHRLAKTLWVTVVIALQTATQIQGQMQWTTAWQYLVTLGKALR